MTFATLLVASLAATGCDTSRPLAPDAALLRVVLRDGDKSAGRNQVYVTSADSSVQRLLVDGQATLEVKGGAEYEVRVVPRTGYVSSPSLTRRVSISEGKTSTLQFFLNREAGSGLPPEYYGN